MDQARSAGQGLYSDVSNDDQGTGRVATGEFSVSILPSPSRLAAVIIGACRQTLEEFISGSIRDVLERAGASRVSLCQCN